MSDPTPDGASGPSSPLAGLHRNHEQGPAFAAELERIAESGTDSEFAEPVAEVKRYYGTERSWRRTSSRKSRPSCAPHAGPPRAHRAVHPHQPEKKGDGS